MITQIIHAVDEKTDKIIFYGQGFIFFSQLLYDIVRPIFSIDPLHPIISMHILDTVLYTFPMVLAKRICLTIKNFFSW